MGSPTRLGTAASGRMGWLLGAIATLAVAAVVVAAVFTMTSEEQAAVVSDPIATQPAVASTGGSLFTSEELELMRLANQGLIPRAAVDWELMELKRLVGLGLIPAAALEPASEPVEPLITAEERLMMDLANRGLIPTQAVDWETIELKRLVNLGLIPRQAVP